MLGTKFDGSIFRHDSINLIAKNPQLASIDGAMVGYDSGGYVSGQVMAYNNVSQLWQKYANSAASGLGGAVGFLLDNPPVDNTTCSGSVPLRVVVRGEVWKAAVVGLVSGVETDLKAREYVDFTGATIITF